MKLIMKIDYKRTKCTDVGSAKERRVDGQENSRFTGITGSSKAEARGPV